jgi:hypothetical protein
MTKQILERLLAAQEKMMEREVSSLPSKIDANQDERKADKKK